MSDLQLILILLGVAVVCLVLFFNWWQERKYRLKVASSFIEPKQDALIDDFSLEIDADERQAVVSDESPLTDLDKSNEANITEAEKAVQQNFYPNELQQIYTPTAFEPQQDTGNDRSLSYANGGEYQTEKSDVDGVSSTDELGTTPYLRDVNGVDNEHIKELSESIAHNELEHASSTEYLAANENTGEVQNTHIEGESEVIELNNWPLTIDDRIDLIAILEPLNGLSPMVLKDFIDVEKQLDKHFQLYVKDPHDEWHDVKNNEVLPAITKEIVCSLQLADRAGPVSRTTFNRFLNAAEILSLELNAHIKWVNHGNTLEIAEDLDRFCLDVDKLIRLHLVQGEAGAFHGTKFKGLAETNDFKLNKNGLFDLTTTESKEPLFSISNIDKQPFTLDNLRSMVLRGVTFQMDIPRVENGPKVFHQMVHIAKKMQVNLNAQLVDDQQKILTDVQLDKVEQQLQAICKAMEARGIVAGSPLALRLFT